MSGDMLLARSSWKLLRAQGTTGSENGNGDLFMTTDPNYAATYVQNGGQVVEVTIPRSTIYLMQQNSVLNVSPNPQYHVNGTYGVEYRFNSSVKPFIIPRSKY
jgi:hypothetical protein